MTQASGSDWFNSEEQQSSWTLVDDLCTAYEVVVTHFQVVILPVLPSTDRAVSSWRPPSASQHQRARAHISSHSSESWDLATGSSAEATPTLRQILDDLDLASRPHPENSHLEGPQRILYIL